MIDDYCAIWNKDFLKEMRGFTLESRILQLILKHRLGYGECGSIHCETFGGSVGLRISENWGGSIVGLMNPHICDGIVPEPRKCVFCIGLKYDQGDLLHWRGGGIECCINCESRARVFSGNQRTISDRSFPPVVFPSKKNCPWEQTAFIQATNSPPFVEDLFLICASASMQTGYCIRYAHILIWPLFKGGGDEEN